MPERLHCGPNTGPALHQRVAPSFMLGDARRVKTGLGVAVYLEGRALTGCPLESLCSDPVQGSSGKIASGEENHAVTVSSGLAGRLDNGGSTSDNGGTALMFAAHLPQGRQLPGR